MKKGFSLATEFGLAFDIGLSDGFHVVPQIEATTFAGSDSYTVTDDTVRLRAGLGFYF